MAGLLGLWALAWALVPPILKSQAGKIAGEELGRKVTIGNVDFKPWSLELTVDDLAVATARVPAANGGAAVPRRGQGRDGDVTCGIGDVTCGIGRGVCTTRRLARRQHH